MMMMMMMMMMVVVVGGDDGDYDNDDNIVYHHYWYRYYCCNIVVTTTRVVINLTVFSCMLNHDKSCGFMLYTEGPTLGQVRTWLQPSNNSVPENFRVAIVTSTNIITCAFPLVIPCLTDSPHNH